MTPEREAVRGEQRRIDEELKWIAEEVVKRLAEALDEAGRATSPPGSVVETTPVTNPIGVEFSIEGGAGRRDRLTTLLADIAAQIVALVDPGSFSCVAPPEALGYSSASYFDPSIVLGVRAWARFDAERLEEVFTIGLIPCTTRSKVADDP